MSLALSIGIIAVVIVAIPALFGLRFQWEHVVRSTMGPYELLQLQLPNLTIEQLRRKFPDSLDERKEEFIFGARYMFVSWFLATVLWIITASMIDHDALYGITTDNAIGLMVMSSLAIAATTFVVHLMLMSATALRELEQPVERPSLIMHRAA